MGSRPTSELLQLPVRLHGIRLGQPVDALLDLAGRRVLGFVVLCGDEAQRFLPWAAAEPREEEIGVVSPLMLLDDVAFYSARSQSLRALRGEEVQAPEGRPAGTLRDVLVAADGAIEELEVEQDGAVRRIAAAAASLVSPQASAA